MSTTRFIGVAAHSGEFDEKLEELARLLVENISKHCPPIAIILGGYWGLMKVVADEAIAKGMPVVILPPLEKEDVDFPEKAIVIRSGLSFRLRSVVLARSCDVLVALGGGAGVIQEVVTAYTEGKPIFLLKSGMDSDKLEYLAPFIDYRKLAPIKVYTDVDQLTRDLCEFLEKHSRTGIQQHG